LKLQAEWDKFSKETTFIVPFKVFEEFSRKATERNQELVKSTCHILKFNFDSRLKRFLEEDSGEIFVLSYGLNLKQKNEQYFCVIDESIARTVAETFEISKIGSIGVLKIMYEKRMLEMEKLLVLKKIIVGSDFRINPDHLSWIN